MRRVIVCGLLAALVATLAVVSNRTAESAAGTKNPNLGKLRHVVLFKFKEGTTPEQIKSFEKAFCELPSKVPTIVDFEWGTDCSVEGISKGFTHCFLVTFKDAKGREVYLPHPAHKGFVEKIMPHLEEPLVVDYVVRQ